MSAATLTSPHTSSPRICEHQRAGKACTKRLKRHCGYHLGSTAGMADMVSCSRIARRLIVSHQTRCGHTGVRER